MTMHQNTHHDRKLSYNLPPRTQIQSRGVFYPQTDRTRRHQLSAIMARYASSSRHTARGLHSSYLARRPFWRVSRRYDDARMWCRIRLDEADFLMRYFWVKCQLYPIANEWRRCSIWNQYFICYLVLATLLAQRVPFFLSPSYTCVSYTRYPISSTLIVADFSIWWHSFVE